MPAQLHREVSHGSPLPYMISCYCKLTVALWLPDGARSAPLGLQLTQRPPSSRSALPHWDFLPTHRALSPSPHPQAQGVQGHSGYPAPGQAGEVRCCGGPLEVRRGKTTAERQ